MNRLIARAPSAGLQDVLPDENPYTSLLSFSLVSLLVGATHYGRCDGREIVAIVLSGTVSVTVNGEQYTGLGGRRDVFEGLPTAVYLPLDASFTIIAESAAEVALCASRADRRYSPFVVRPEDVLVTDRGERNWRRTVRDVVTDRADGRVDRIIVGEAINEPGYWSSFPPHKHDGEFAPAEPNFEEIYHYRIDRPAGYSVQLHYTTDHSLDDAYIVRDGDAFVIDKGCHPTVAAGGCRIYYLRLMAGTGRRALQPYIDPDFRWLTAEEALHA